MSVPADKKVTLGLKKKKKNSHFSDIFFYQTLNIILGREKKRFFCKIILIHDPSQKGPLNFIYYIHMWVILEKIMWLLLAVSSCGIS